MRRYQPARRGRVEAAAIGTAMVAREAVMP